MRQKLIALKVNLLSIKTMLSSNFVESELQKRLRRNNFDFLRLFFSSVVCISHCVELGSFHNLKIIKQIFSPEVSVRAFFVISGFLIFLSYERSITLRSYFEKRIRRIFPGYAFVIIVTATGLFFVSSLDARDFFGAEWIRFVVANLLFMNFLQPSLPGVFDGNLHSAVNGALWTLKIEVMFYCVVPIFVWLFGKFGRFRILIFGYFLSLLYLWLCQYLAQRTGRGFFLELGRQLPGQLVWFFSGAILLYYFKVLNRYRYSALMVSILMLCASAALSGFSFVEPIALGVLVVSAGLYFYLGEFGKFGDFSYGVYIIHFPIIQILLNYGVFGSNALSFIGGAFGITLIFAILLWFFVEKPWLSTRSHYIGR